MIKNAVKGERPIRPEDWCLRDAKGIYHLVDEIEWSKLVGKGPVEVTTRPRIFLVTLNLDTSRAELWDEWIDSMSWRDALASFEDEPEIVLALAGWDIGADGKPGETQIFEPKEAEALDARIRE